MARLRYNGLSNSLGAALTSGGTTITFASKLTYAGGDVPTITGSDYIPLSILDADGKCAEVVHLTAYTSAATTGTIARGKEDTSGVAHDSGAVVVHGPTAGVDQPVFCDVALTADEATAAATTELIVWEQQRADSHSMTDIGGSNPERITVPYNGLYLVTGSIQALLGGTVGNNEIRFRLLVNNTFEAWMYRHRDGGDLHVFPFTQAIELSANDYISFDVWTEAASTVFGADGFEDTRCQVSLLALT